MGMKARWEELTSGYGADPMLVVDYWQEIERQYSQPTRHYHNLEHLRFMLRQSEQVREQLAEPKVVQFSIFYHDIIYNARRQDNEEKSADLARVRLLKLGLPAEQIQRCAAQILATKGHQTAADPDTNLLLDIDLAILGADLPAYQNYTRQIRAEYAMYPNFLYRNGRRKVLQHFLEMPQIYKTSYFRALFEEKARENLTWELKAIGA